MKEYKVTINIENIKTEEEATTIEFLIEAESIEEAESKMLNDLGF